MMSMNLSDIAILNIKGFDYYCIVSLIRKKWSHKLNARFWFVWKKWNIFRHKDLLSQIKIGKKIQRLGTMKLEKIKFTTVKFLFF